MKHLPQAIIVLACLAAFAWAAPAKFSSDEDHSMDEFEKYYQQVAERMDKLAEQYKDEEYIQHFTSQLRNGLIQLKKTTEDIAKQEKDAQKRQKAINFAYESVERLNRFIDDVLEVIDQVSVN